jgi:hypothetical protein
MTETSRHGHEAVIAHDKAPKMPEPGEGTLPNPPPPVSPQLPSVLLGRPLVVGAGWDERLEAPTRPACPQGVAVIAAIGHQPFRALAGAPGVPWSPDGNGVEGLFEARDLRRGCRVQGLLPTEGPVPSTRIIPLVPLPRLGLPTWTPLFSPGRSSHPQSIRPNAVSAGH